jgi:transcription elongation factor
MKKKIMQDLVEYASKSEEIKFGDKVKKVTGDYKFSGTVVSVFQKLSGQTRYVVENNDGILHIFSAANLRIK